MPNNLEEKLRTIQNSISYCRKEYKKETNEEIKEKILQYKQCLEKEEKKVLKELGDD